MGDQLRDCESGIERGDRQFALLMQGVLLRAMVLGRGRLSARTFTKHRRHLDRLLAQLLRLKVENEPGQWLQRRDERI